MIRYIYPLFAILFFVSCDNKDSLEPIDPNDYLYLEYTIGNDYSFSSSDPSASISSSDMLRINAASSNGTIELRVYNFSQRTSDEIVYFSVPSMGIVEYNGSNYNNFYTPPYEGELVFTTLTEERIVGYFNFKAQNVDPNNFNNINVSNGTFDILLN